MFPARRWRLLAAGIVCVAAAGSPAGTPGTSPYAGAGLLPPQLPPPRILEGDQAGGPHGEVVSPYHLAAPGAVPGPPPAGEAVHGNGADETSHPGERISWWQRW